MGTRFVYVLVIGINSVKNMLTNSKADLPGTAGLVWTGWSLLAGTRQREKKRGSSENGERQTYEIYRSMREDTTYMRMRVWAKGGKEQKELALLS